MGFVTVFSVGYDIVNKSNILDIHISLMKNIT